MEKELEKITNPKDLAILIKKNYILVIKISASWCGPCKNKKFLEEYKQIKNNYNNIKGVKFIELDIDDDSDLIEDKTYYNMEIDSVPCFLITKNGCFTRKYVGGGYLDQINQYLQEKTNSIK